MKPFATLTGPAGGEDDDFEVFGDGRLAVFRAEGQQAAATLQVRSATWL